MNTNRLQEVAPAPKEPPRRLPIIVTLVMRQPRDSMDAVVKEIRDFCNDSSLIFQSRAYDSWRYKHDRDEVLRLPALHIAVNGLWKRTFYPNTRPLQHIEEVVNEYLAALEKKRAKKGRFKRRLRGFEEKVKTWFHRETAMEKHEREETARRASMTTAAGAEGDWELRIAAHRRSSIVWHWG